jgi:hypothetical protein
VSAYACLVIVRVSLLFFIIHCQAFSYQVISVSCASKLVISVLWSVIIMRLKQYVPGFVFGVFML